MTKTKPKKMKLNSSNLNQVTWYIKNFNSKTPDSNFQKIKQQNRNDFKVKHRSASLDNNKWECVEQIELKTY